jgi:hypothetical protein
MELQLFQRYRYVSQNFIVILSKCLCFTYFHIILTKYATHELYKIATEYLKAGFHSLGSLKWNAEKYPVTKKLEQLIYIKVKPLKQVM